LKRLRFWYREGRPFVTLRQIKVSVSHVVLEAFVGPRLEGMEACHFPDRDPNNNAVSNLRWDTHAGNVMDQYIHGTTNKGKRNGMALLDDYEVAQMIRELLAGPKGYGAIAKVARRHGVARDTFAGIVRGEYWQHVSARFKTDLQMFREGSKSLGRGVTPTMVRVLDDIANGLGTHHNCHGKSEHGGRARVVIALRRYGLTDADNELTEKGTELLKRSALRNRK